MSRIAAKLRYASSRTSAVRITETILTISAPQNADQNPSTKNPMCMLTASEEAIMSVAALITSTNKPSVRRISGHESSFRIGQHNRVYRPNTIAIPANAPIPSRAT